DTDIDEVPGNVGDTIYLSENGRYSTNNTDAKAAFVKLETNTPNIMRGHVGGSITPGSLFILNGTIVSVGGAGSIDDVVSAINGASIEGIAASNVSNSLVITEENGKDIVIWDDISGDFTDSFGIRNFKSGKKIKILSLDRSVTSKQKLINPSYVYGLPTQGGNIGDVIEFDIDGDIYDLTLSGNTTDEFVNDVNGNVVLRRYGVIAETDSSDRIVIKYLNGGSLTLTDDTGTSVVDIFGTSPISATQTSANGFFLKVKNNSGSEIDKTKVVKLNTYDGDDDYYISPVNSLSDRPLGISIKSISDQSYGRIVTHGIVSTNLDTTGRSVGDLIYFDSNGDLTFTNSSVPVGFVYQIGTQARIMVTLFGSLGGSGGGLDAVEDDTDPHLGGDLNVNGWDIYSDQGNNIVLDPRDGGIVEIHGDGPGGIEAAETFDLELRGGSNDGVNPAGNTVIVGGEGSTTLAGGDVIIRGGDSDVSAGSVKVQDSTGGDVVVIDGIDTVNGLLITGGNTGNGISIDANGFDTDIDLIISSKGNGNIILDGQKWPSDDGINGQILTTDGNGDLYWGNAGSGSTTFIGLTDTPLSYNGFQGYVVRVNSTEDGLEFSNPPNTSRIENFDSTVFVDTEYSGYDDSVVIGSNGYLTTLITSLNPSDNEHLSIVADNGKISFVAQSDTTSSSIDVEFQAQADGVVRLGNTTGNVSVIYADDGLDLIIAAGEDVSLGKDTIIRPGNGLTYGKIQFQNPQTDPIVMIIDDGLSADWMELSNTSITMNGGSADIDISLIPKGQGFILSYSGYDMSNGPDHALVTKGYVDNVVVPSSTFIGLTDTPLSYASNAGKLVAVNGNEDGLEFVESEKIRIVDDIAERDLLTPSNGDMVFVEDTGEGEWGLYMWNSTWIQLVNQDSSDVDSQTISVLIDYTDISPTFIHRISSGTRVTDVSVEIIQTFDNSSATMSVGDAGDNQRLFDISMIDMEEIGVYVNRPFYQYGGSTETELYVYFDFNGSTQGQMRVTITYS
ncbi:MAG: hypothetical protein WC284_18020, partial [Candidimonas sp.]